MRRRLKWVTMICLCVMFLLAQTVWAGNRSAVSIRLSPARKTIYVGESFTIKATVKGTSKKVTWTSLNKKTATVKNGKVTARKAGTAKIVAKANGKKAICTVTVKQKKFRTGFYVGGQNNVRRVAVRKITGNYVTFDMAYSGMRMAVARNIRADLRKGGKFTFKDDWGASGQGRIILLSGYVKIQVPECNSMCSTGNKWIKLKRVSGSTDILTIY